MAVFKERNTSRAGYWIAGEALEKSWLPAYFAPEFKELDDLPKKSGDEYVLLDKLVRLHQAIPSKTATAKADWLIVDRKGTMVTELFHGELGGETVQVVPNDSLVISPFFSDRLSVCYWEEEIFRGRAVTSARNIVLVPAGSRPIAWLAAELNSRICSLQLRRITAGTAAQEIDPEALLDILVPGHSKKTLANLVKKVRRGSFRDAEQARRSLFSADLRSNLQPLILTGATFEERIRQFENYLLEHKIVSVGDAFFVEASSRGKDSGNFVVRPVGRFGQGDFGPASNWLQPQEDLEELRAWNNWYWDTDPKTRVAIFNTLLREDALPGTLLAKTLANPWSPRSPFSGPRVLPSFYNYRAALRQIIFRDEIDLKNFYDEVSSLWMRHNQKDDLTEKIVNWFRKIYRPVAASKSCATERSPAHIFSSAKINGCVRKRRRENSRPWPWSFRKSWGDLPISQMMWLRRSPYGVCLG